MSGTKRGILSLDIDGKIKFAGQRTKIDNLITDNIVDMVQTKNSLTKINYKTVENKKRGHRRPHDPINLLSMGKRIL